MTELVAVDIGGTHARFAVAEIDSGRVRSLARETVLQTAEHSSLEAAWQAFAAGAGRPLPAAAAIAVACPVTGETLKLTNNRWVIRSALLPARLGLDSLTLVNDFAAVAHAVAEVGDEHLRHVCGPDLPLPADGVISVVGPGTGLGVAQLLRRDGRSHVIATEGGHIGFAPLDPFEDRLLIRLRQRHGRVSAERIVAGPGLVAIHQLLGGDDQPAVAGSDDRALWAAALRGDDHLAVAALERFCCSLGAVAGDLALAHGSAAVVIAGGLGLHLADRLPRSGFAGRFVAKGRFESRMAALPVKLLTHPQPGLLGAAAAYAEQHCR